MFNLFFAFLMIKIQSRFAKIFVVPRNSHNIKYAKTYLAYWLNLRETVSRPIISCCWLKHPLVIVAFVHNNWFVHNSFKLWPCLFQDVEKSTAWSLLTPLRGDSRLPMFSFKEKLTKNVIQLHKSVILLMENRFRVTSWEPASLIAKLSAWLHTNPGYPLAYICLPCLCMPVCVHPAKLIYSGRGG